MNIEFPLLNLSGSPPVEQNAIPCEDFHAYRIKQCEWYNGNKGKDDGTGVECSRCYNKGLIAKLNPEDNIDLVECSCMKMRRSMQALQRSGLAEQTKRLTFDTFNAVEEWQIKAKGRALLFLRESHKGKWFFIGGQSGCGKTHLCTAICSKLIAIGREVHYCVWFDIFHELQSLQFKEEYKNRLLEYQNCDVLYIDDFLKNFEPKTKTAQKSFAFELINARYISGKTTIISSEFHVDVLGKIDRAIAGRIVEKASGFVVQIKYASGRNYREQNLGEL